LHVVRHCWHANSGIDCVVANALAAQPLTKATSRGRLRHTRDASPAKPAKMMHPARSRAQNYAARDERLFSKPLFFDALFNFLQHSRLRGKAMHQ
jgi:hypothetical protein